MTFSIKLHVRKPCFSSAHREKKGRSRHAKIIALEIPQACTAVCTLQLPWIYMCVEAQTVRHPAALVHMYGPHAYQYSHWLSLRSDKTTVLCLILWQKVVNMDFTSGADHKSHPLFQIYLFLPPIMLNILKSSLI